MLGIIFQRLCKPILLHFPALSRGGLLTKVVRLFVLGQLVFIADDLTAFCFYDLQGEAYIHLKGLILTRTLRDLKDLKSFFTIIGKGSPNCLFLTIVRDYINDQSQLNRRHFTLGKFS